ncbi:TetR/AcrR family transcriptional regulator [Sediminibacterium soli]|uniref:TetR/AcrR family transcriptional regulator n=1 Tax=Sediminibacterium soli TaxID=2698829 RepID=UPI00137B7666|nr:TetR/AcrR family transcriptional regulator [Sediminibacterium soli]NCI46191.1 TetR/AcrR family transcriptional regulator [Sediminibacterium soli]
MKLRDDKKTQQIFDAVLSLVKEKGLAGVTMGEIARHAGMATGTLYIYFTNKEELISTLFSECRKASLESYFRDYNEDLPFKSGFRIVWNNILQFRIQNFEDVVFLDQCYHSPFINECTMKLTKQMKKPLYKLIEKGKEENIFKDMDTVSLLTFLFGVIHEAAKNAHYQRRPMTQSDIDALFRLCWDGMKR